MLNGDLVVGCFRFFLLVVDIANLCPTLCYPENQVHFMRWKCK